MELPLPEPTGTPEIIEPITSKEIDHLEEGELVGERRIATVVMADVRNSTDLLEKIGTEEWVELMNRVFQVLESEIYKYEGEIDQFRGDGLVAFFGATTAHEDDPERAVLAALAMQDAIKSLSNELKLDGDELLLRVGVNTGQLIVTRIGGYRHHQEDTAMGEAISIAARMETAAEPGTVLVSENTYWSVESQFEWKPLGEITAKGISKPISVFRPIEPRSGEDWIHDFHSYPLSLSIIGLELETQIFKECIDDLFEGRGGILHVTGDKGVGKSFLVDQMRLHFNRLRTLLPQARENVGSEFESESTIAISEGNWLRGRCRSYNQSSPFTMWYDLLHYWMGKRPDDSTDAKNERLLQLCFELWDDRLGNYYPYLATFLSLPLEEKYLQRVRHLDAEGLQTQLVRSVYHWVEAVARTGPIVLSISDAHWADSASLELLEQCLPLCETHAILWITVFRPERNVPVWNFHHRVETGFPHRLITIALTGLNEKDSGVLIDRTIGVDTLSEATREMIIQKSEGNPYFIVELVRSLISQGKLTQETSTGIWREIEPVDSLDIPDSLQSLLMERIDRLTPEDCEALQIASVVGLTFWENVLVALSSDKDLLYKHLITLQREQMIQERGRVLELGIEYKFKSSLIREVVYNRLLKSQRANYHLKIAEFLEGIVGVPDWTHYCGMLAYHYQHAGVFKKEMYFRIMAADQARRINANTEALEHYSRALKILDRMETSTEDPDTQQAIYTQKLEVFNDRREVYFSLGEVESANQDARALLPLARNIKDDRSWLIDALLKQPEVDNPQSQEDIKTAVPMVEEAYSLSQQLGDKYRQMLSLGQIAYYRHSQNDPSWEEIAARTLALAREYGDKRAEVRVLLTIGEFLGLDKLDLALNYLEKALPIAEDLEDKSTELHLLRIIGQQYERSGDYYRYLTEFEQRRLRISREIGHRLWEGQTLMFCGQIMALYLGDHDAGLALEKEAYQIWKQLPDRLFPLMRIVQIYLEQGEYDEAKKSLETAQPLAEEILNRHGEVGLQLVTAMYYNTQCTDEALEKSLEISEVIPEFVDQHQVLSRQYTMVAACKIAESHLCLLDRIKDNKESQYHREQAIIFSTQAVKLYYEYGFTQAIEVVSEEILFRHSQALNANHRENEGREYQQRAYEEMMRKHDLIPPDSHYRRTFLENIKIHQEIKSAYQNL
jgi:class 3 adenylate cyclase/predicted ATPase